MLEERLFLPFVVFSVSFLNFNGDRDLYANINIYKFMYKQTI